MRYRRQTVRIQYENGAFIRLEILSKPDEIRVFRGSEEIPRLPAGTPKSLFEPGATGTVSETDYFFEIDGNYFSVRPNGRLRPMVTAFSGLAQFTFGRTEILTVTCIGALFLALIVLVILL